MASDLGVVRHQCADVFDDDKHAKYYARTTDKTGKDAQISGLRDVGVADIKTIAQSPRQSYLVFLMATSVLYYLAGGSLQKASMDHLLGYVSCIIEAAGLLTVLKKIEEKGSVAGISGESFVMYFVLYVLRQVVMMPSFSLPESHEVDSWTTILLQMPSIVFVSSILRSVYRQHKETYHVDGDILKAQYVIPACIIAAVPLHPFMVEGFVFSVGYASYMYLDVLALLPQVVMMARGGGKVEAPIAHFVAATAVSRLVDLFFWYYAFDLGPQGYIWGFNYSGWLIVFTQVISLCLVADFMYYYMKARFSGAALSEDLSLPLEDMC